MAVGDVPKSGPSELGISRTHGLVMGNLHWKETECPNYAALNEKNMRFNMADRMPGVYLLVSSPVTSYSSGDSGLDWPLELRRLLNLMLSPWYIFTSHFTSLF